MHLSTPKLALSLALSALLTGCLTLAKASQKRKKQLHRKQRKFALP